MQQRCIRLLLAVCVGSCISLTSLAAGPSPKIEPPAWLPLAQDELHDPKNPSINLLQNPAEALSQLPRGTAGNQVDWVKALRGHSINPVARFYAKTEIRILDQNVMLTRRISGEMDRVIFPHKQHTEWVDCSGCHEELFKSKAGANQITMFAILNGEFCGRCHGAVAFPPTECNRCHNVPRAPVAAPAKTR